ncbi:MAG: calcium/sodium antiporter [Bacteroidales bacterium]|nr:calcium/sodium antiporter [Bacteroidales bacterium]
MLVSGFLIIAGFVALIFGANWLVDGASSLAKKHHISDLAIGLTLVAFGTSAPELVVNAIASYQGYSDIVLGNIIGSNNFNLFIILGVAGLIFPISVQSSTVWREIPISFFAAVVLLLIGNAVFNSDYPKISRFDGLLLITLFALFLFYVYKQMKTEETAAIALAEKSNIKIWALIFGGLVGLLIGGQLVVSNSIELATSLGISEKIIGLTIVAAGTSLPELITSIVAAMKKNSDIAIGNVVGSNVFNILLILSVSAFIKPINYNANFNLDIAILLGGTLFLFIAMFTGKRKKLDRWEAGLLLGFYFFYTIYLVYKEL